MFPQFNIYSIPLLILICQGLIFAALLIQRYFKERKAADLLIVLILGIMVYHRTTYTIGFMGWYDTFKNTKINYYLFSLSLAMGPVIYLYIRSTLVAPFTLRKNDWWHFLPIFLYVFYRLVLLIHDYNGPGWELGYEGEWLRDIHVQYVSTFASLLEMISQILYLAFTIQLVMIYNQKINQYFSNTYKVELNWIKVFLAVYIFLFAFATVFVAIDAFIMDLDYKHMWWIHLFSSVAIVYLGIKAYYTDLSRLHDLTFDLDYSEKSTTESPSTFQKEVEKIKQILDENQGFLNPDFTLKDLAESLNMSRNEVSESINSGFGFNFNELINSYRIEKTKEMISNPDNDHLSLIAIAYDCGFNSKATFNRVFKQKTGISPSQFKASQVV